MSQGGQQYLEVTEEGIMEMIPVKVGMGGGIVKFGLSLFFIVRCIFSFSC